VPPVPASFLPALPARVGGPGHRARGGAGAGAWGLRIRRLLDALRKLTVRR
jgi:hypothetical protein